MKNFLFGLSISVAFILGCAAAHLTQTLTVPEAHARMTGPLWEGHCVDADSAGVDSPEWDERLAGDGGWNKALNKFGAQGWEPFQVFSHTGNNEIQYVCFRRPSGGTSSPPETP